MNRSSQELKKLKQGDKVFERYGPCDVNDITAGNLVKTKILYITKRTIVLSPECHYSRVTGQRWGQSPWGDGGCDLILPCRGKWLIEYERRQAKGGK